MSNSENKKGRSELKTYFVKNAIPTESNFAEFIDSVLNQRDDGLVKEAGNPLSIEAAGDDSSQKRAINLYHNFTDEKPTWVLSLNPRSDPNNAASAHKGFSIGDAVGNSRLFIDAQSGKIGVGTIEPNATLDIRGNLSISGDQSFGSQVRQMINLWGTSYGIGVQAWTQYFRTDRNFAWYKDGTHKDEELTSGSGTVQMVLRDGQLGIGTSDPKARLDVRGAVSFGNSDIYFTKTDHNHTGAGNTSGHAAIENAKNYDALMILGRAGTDKGRKVRLWDYLKVEGTLANLSDVRSKKDIQNLEYGLEEVKKLRPVSFNWRKIHNEHKSIGLIGHEVQAVIDKVVYDDHGELSISYVNLIPVLINAIKELDGKVEMISSTKDNK